MEVYIGTSGWFYSWNPVKNFTWYVENSGLNAVELNASFYRFPFPNQVKSWVEKGQNIRFAIKVSRRITHIHRLKDESYPIWEAFLKLFSPLQSQIVFYLFQFPPSFRPDQFDSLARFFQLISPIPHCRFAIEMRNTEWFQEMWIKKMEQIPAIFVSVDSPDFQKKIILSQGIIYIRFHGRTDWYNHNYTTHELEEIADSCCILKPEKIYAFFNNDHHMLDNAQSFYNILIKKI